MSKEYDWYIDADLSAYAQKWVAISGTQIVLSAGSAAELLAELDKNPSLKRKNPLVTKVSGTHLVL